MNILEFEELFIYYDETEDLYMVLGRKGEKVVPLVASDEISELK